LYAPLLAPIRAMCSAHFSLLDFIIQWYLVRSTDHKSPCYVVFSTPLFSVTHYKKCFWQSSLIKDSWHFEVVSTFVLLA
jgi:hypothetical protein